MAGRLAREGAAFDGAEDLGKGAPYLLVNCAWSFLRTDCEDREATAPFLFSHRACGSNRLGYAPSTRYEGGKFDLGDAMAISGGAITPTATRNMAVQALMWLMNWRLGRWMANPSVRALLDQPVAYRRIWQRPQALHLLLSWLLVPEKDRDFHFVSDGGLHENLGIEPLIERRCKLIFAIDAGADPKEQFEDLVKLLLRLRLHHGVEIEALNENSPLGERTAAAVLARSPLARLLARDQRGQAAATGLCQSHFVLAKIKYPDREEPAWLVYIRPGFDGDESETLRRFRTQNTHFPNDSTDDQFYSFARFEAYRLLGEHIGHSVCAGDAGPRRAEDDSGATVAVEKHAAAAQASTAFTASTTDIQPAAAPSRRHPQVPRPIPGRYKVSSSQPRRLSSRKLRLRTLRKEQFKTRLRMAINPRPVTSGRTSCSTSWNRWWTKTAWEKQCSPTSCRNWWPAWMN